MAVFEYVVSWQMVAVDQTLANNELLSDLLVDGLASRAARILFQSPLLAICGLRRRRARVRGKDVLVPMHVHGRNEAYFGRNQSSIHTSSPKQLRSTLYHDTIACREPRSFHFSPTLNALEWSHTPGVPGPLGRSKQPLRPLHEARGPLPPHPGRLPPSREGFPPPARPQARRGTHDL